MLHSHFRLDLTKYGFILTIQLKYGLFGGLPERTALARQLGDQQAHTDCLLAQPSVLNGADNDPIELLFPLREGPTQQQVGKKGTDTGRWTVGLQRCWISNPLGQLCGWPWDPLNCPDNTFLDLFEVYQEQAILLADVGFRCAHGLPDKVKVCKKDTWNDRLALETTFSLLTVVTHPKQMCHPAEAYIGAQLAYTAAMFNMCLDLFHPVHPDASPFKVSIAQFSL